MKNNKIFSVSVLLIAALWAVLNSGCNTIHGAGKDIEKAGDKIQESADKHR